MKTLSDFWPPHWPIASPRQLHTLTRPRRKCLLSAILPKITGGRSRAPTCWNETRRRSSASSSSWGSSQRRRNHHLLVEVLMEQHRALSAEAPALCVGGEHGLHAGAGVIPSQHRSLRITKYPGSNEGLDKSIVQSHYGSRNLLCNSGVIVHYSTLLAL